jgi:hypothetical protein
MQCFHVVLISIAKRIATAESSTIRAKGGRELR